MNLRQISLIARFELQDALRSRLVMAIVLLFGVGAGLGCYLFFQALEAAETQIRETLVAGGALAAELEPNLVRSQALPRLIHSVVDDRTLAEQLSSVAPLALFYAWGAFLFSAPLALVLSAGSHARDRAGGAVRYLLTRTDRGSWAVGKLVGHQLLLAMGIALGAVVTAVVALRYGTLDAGSTSWLGTACARAWIYSGSYLCLFAGVSLVASSPARARAGSVLLSFLLWLGHLLVQPTLGAAPDSLISDKAGSQTVGHVLQWFFPAHYKYLLWSAELSQSLTAAAALIAIGIVGFTIGLSLFRRGNA